MTGPRAGFRRYLLLDVTLHIVQFDRSTGKPEENHNKMIGWLKSIPPPADIILLPEAWLGPQIVDLAYYRSVLLDLLEHLPAENTLLVTGAHYVRQNGDIVSTGSFLSQQEIIYYEKLFPSHAIGERNFVAPGRKTPVVSHRGVLLGSVVCVDLFYPEITRRLARRGAQIIFNPANIPAARMDLWQHLGITRAAENTVFLAMANNTHTFYPDGRKVAGRSFVAGPDGQFFTDFGPEPGIYRVDLELELIARTRRRWRYLKDIEEYPL